MAPDFAINKQLEVKILCKNIKFDKNVQNIPFKPETSLNSGEGCCFHIDMRRQRFNHFTQVTCFKNAVRFRRFMK